MTVSAADKIFQCMIIASGGKLLDRKTTSVVFPAHDGQVGVWYNHMPMFCKLGLGIMEVRDIPSNSDILAKDTLLLVDGGIALIGSNLLTVVAHDAIYLHGVEAEKVERMLEKARVKLSRGEYTQQQRSHEIQKFSLITKLARMEGFLTGAPA